MRLTYRPIDTWPGELTTNRRLSPFSGDWRTTLETLEREVGHLTGVNTRKYYADAVLQLALPEHAIRQDGQIKSGSKGPEHPGVILSIDGEHGPLQFACDRFSSPWKGTWSESWRHNVRAIALGLEALRKVERYGLGQGTEQYVGFQALPPGTPMPAAKMSLDQAAELLQTEGLRAGLTQAVFVAQLLDDAELAAACYRAAAKLHHPDAGGDPEMFRRITEARDLLAGAGS